MLAGRLLRQATIYFELVATFGDKEWKGKNLVMKLVDEIMASEHSYNIMT